ncbi:MAG: preprotein translocase subunit YajC, partial [Firmicutes bacterium]|nr:preprotein translocase subunit YajC [Bacillota bacterium]
VTVRDDVLTLEVGSDKVKLVLERWAIRNVEKIITD